MVGIAAVLYMTMEDRLSQNDRLNQAAFHAAEAGLKAGEQVIVRHVSNSTLNSVLDPNTMNDPHNDVPTTQADLTTVQHLGTVLYTVATSGSPLYDVSIGSPTIVGLTESYSLYVRNNANDYQASDGTKMYVDHDGRVNLISRGSVQDTQGREVAVKVLSEQLYFGIATVKPGSYRFNAQGQSSTLY